MEFIFMLLTLLHSSAMISGLLFIAHFQPSTCSRSCLIQLPPRTLIADFSCITRCDRPGTVCQDPRFIGGDGITFYFHSKKDQDFCLVSDSNIHIKAHFIGRRNQDMKRDFTWVQSLGILFDMRRLFIGAKKTSTWDNSVDRLSKAFDGQILYLPEAEGAKWQSESSPEVSIMRLRNTNAVEIEVKGNLKIKAIVVPITEKDSLIRNYGITQEDCYAHLDLSFKFYSLHADVSGVLGQTYAKNYVSRVKMGVAMPVLGCEGEFASTGLFATDCAVTQVVGKLSPSDSTKNLEYSGLNCTGGGDDRGLVCKKAKVGAEAMKQNKNEASPKLHRPM
ncbi:hypothetical protein EUGRSUZ_B03879 [Eucalyptus grandis]|uniref:Uncharacterized protein n=2 Tax=Eucalyptus grandis TaxID=71139 RepID=A0ACC3LY07_EUCGR|nr:hypothetical protein EUGRSUZ_B03879 [Eucalyptus grandis]